MSGIYDGTSLLKYLMVLGVGYFHKKLHHIQGPKYISALTVVNLLLFWKVVAAKRDLRSPGNNNPTANIG